MIMIIKGKGVWLWLCLNTPQPSELLRQNIYTSQCSKNESGNNYKNWWASYSLQKFPQTLTFQTTTPLNPDSDPYSKYFVY